MAETCNAAVVEHTCSTPRTLHNVFIFPKRLNRIKNEMKWNWRKRRIRCTRVRSLEWTRAANWAVWRKPVCAMSICCYSSTRRGNPQQNWAICYKSNKIYTRSLCNSVIFFRFTFLILFSFTRYNYRCIGSATAKASKKFRFRCARCLHERRLLNWILRASTDPLFRIESFRMCYFI